MSNIRAGKFTSSEIHKLMKKGRGGSPSVVTQSYIEEKKMELRLCRSLNSDTSARACTWGHILEERVAFLLDKLEYDYCSDKTLVHPSIPHWAGTPDFITFDRVVDAKCPFTMKGFCELADISIAQDLVKFKETKPEYYWQLVSNSILTAKSKAELITYCPYLSELQDIKDTTSDVDGIEQNKVAWIYFAENQDLPYLLDDGYYKNMYKFVFDVPQEDREALTEAVIVASEELV